MILTLIKCRLRERRGVGLSIAGMEQRKEGSHGFTFGLAVFKCQRSLQVRDRFSFCRAEVPTVGSPSLRELIGTLKTNLDTGLWEGPLPGRASARQVLKCELQ